MNNFNLTTGFCLVILFLSSCNKESNHKDCILLPEVGSCDAAIPKFYFDQSENKCKTFVWGGCDGVVPFETLEDCNNKCPCQDD
jgi:hypothetical protein